MTLLTFPMFIDENNIQHLSRRALCQPNDLLFNTMIKTINMLNKNKHSPCLKSIKNHFIYSSDLELNNTCALTSHNFIERIKKIILLQLLLLQFILLHYINNSLYSLQIWL